MIVPYEFLLLITIMALWLINTFLFSWILANVLDIIID